MRDLERLTCPVVVSPPAGIDIANAEHAGEQLHAAFAPSVSAVTAEMGLTVLCCTFGRRQLVAGCRHSSHVRQIPEADCRASRRPWAGCRAISLLRDRGF